MNLQVNLTEFHLHENETLSYKGHANDGTLLQLAPDSVFKYGSVTCYRSRIVTPYCY